MDCGEQFSGLLNSLVYENKPRLRFKSKEQTKTIVSDVLEFENASTATDANSPMQVHDKTNIYG